MARLNETVRQTGERQANLLETQLDALLVSRLDQAQRRAQSIGESLQSSVEDGLRGVGENSARDLQARLQEIADQAVAASSDQVRKQVEDSANAAAEKAFQAWQVRLQEAAKHAAAAAGDQVQEQINQALKLIGPQLQEMQERAVNDALEAFRARLSQFLGLLHSGGNK